MSTAAFEPGAGGLATILESIPEFVVVVDREGHILYLNRAEPGYELDEVLGMDVHEMLFPSSRYVFEEALAAVLETGEPEEYEVKITLPDGSPAWYRSEMVPLGGEEAGAAAGTDAGGEVEAVLIIASNITALKASQEEAEKLRQLLPICSWCDRIENEEGGWESVEHYLGREGDTAVTHGMCPDCFERQTGGTDHDGESENGNAA